MVGDKEMVGGTEEGWRITVMVRMERRGVNGMGSEVYRMGEWFLV